ncbi:MAG: GNAT family N-acetyltransferase [Candidatus Eisenbacteria bacterium]|nr:GNAT family N-acetyltransferase [Candidatus Eisenbacteria bacterium]
MADRYEAEILDRSDLDGWDRLVGHASGGTLFNTGRWFRILGETLGKDWLVIGCRKNGVLVGGCAGATTRRAGLDLFLPPPLTAYAGMVLADPESEKACEGTEDTLRRASVLESALRLRFALSWTVHHPSTPDLRPFVWNGWESIPRYTYLLPLRADGDLWSGLKSSLRNKIRKAEKAGIRARRAEDLSGAIRFYADSYEKHGASPPIPPERLLAWFDGLRREGIARGYLAEDERGEPLAFRIALVDGERAYDWVAGADTARLSDGATPLLYWKEIEDLRADREFLDMMGANTPTIAGFKSGFGGDLVPYWETRRFRSPLVRALFRARGRFGR